MNQEQSETPMTPSNRAGLTLLGAGLLVAALLSGVSCLELQPLPPGGSGGPGGPEDGARAPGDDITGDLPEGERPEASDDEAPRADRPPRPGRPGGEAGARPGGEPPGPRGPAAVLSPRDRQYLARTLESNRKLQRAIGDIGGQRLAGAALSAAALASVRRGSEARETRAEAGRFAGEALDLCRDQWTSNHCERGLLYLQRIALQYPRGVPRPVLQRLRRETVLVAPAPAGAQARNPWDFQQTENQRIVTMARSLAGLAVGGRGGSPEGRDWSTAAERFLLAHDRQGWYEGDSPGYLSQSIDALLLIADHAPSRRVRSLATRQLHLLFAAWAQEQVGGYPAGALSRTYLQWALFTNNTPWPAWYWLLTGQGGGQGTNFLDGPGLAAAAYQVPDALVDLAANRRQREPYAIEKRRRFDLVHRRDLDAALYSWATPDYILSAAQAVDGLVLGVSGGQEVMATLFAEGPEFAPLYLWSRNTNPRSDRWRSWASADQAAAHRLEPHGAVALARVGRGDPVGHAYLAPPWGRPEAVGDALVGRYGDTYFALHTVGGFELLPAGERFPGYYGEKKLRGAWVAVPRTQPAVIALEVGRRAEVGDFPAWKERARGAELSLGGPEQRVLRYRASGGTELAFDPGRRLTVGGEVVQAARYPVFRSPYLSSGGSGGDSEGRWRFTDGPVRYDFEPLPQ